MLLSCRQLRPHLRIAAYATRAPTTAQLSKLKPPPNDLQLLPPLKLWKQYFPPLKGHRVAVGNPETARRMASGFLGPETGDKFILEANPGPGALTRAFLNDQRVKRIVVLEPLELFRQYLYPLQEKYPQLTVLPFSESAWESFTAVEKGGYLKDVAIHPWDAGIHPQFHYVSHITAHKSGEQLLSQFIRLMPGKQWLFQYGRITMNFLLSDYLYRRVAPTPGSTKTRCKLSVITEACADVSEAVPSEELEPYKSHFYPKAAEHKSAKEGNPHCAITVTPKEHPLILPRQLDHWDYCLRRMFVKKKTSIHEAIQLLGPGANILIPKITDPSLPESERITLPKLVQDMTVQDWAVLVKAFHEWPFAPQDLDIDFLLEDIQSNRR